MSQRGNDIFTPEGLGYTIPEIDLSAEDIEMLEEQDKEEYLDVGQIINKLSKADYDTDALHAIQNDVKRSTEDRVIDLDEIDEEDSSNDLYKLFSKQDHTQISAREAIVKTENYLKIMNEEEHLLLQSRLTGVPLNTLLHGLELGTDDLEQLYEDDDDDLELLEQEDADPYIQYENEENDQVIQEIADEICMKPEFIRDEFEEEEDIIDSEEEEEEDLEEIEDEGDIASNIVMSRTDLDKPDIIQDTKVEEIEEEDEVVIPQENDDIESGEEVDEVIILQDEINKDRLTEIEDGEDNIAMDVSQELTIKSDDEELDESIDYEFDGAIIATKGSTPINVDSSITIEEVGAGTSTITTEDDEEEDDDSLDVADIDSLHVKKGNDNGSKTYSLKELNLEGGFD